MKFERLSGKNRVIYECMWGTRENLGFDIEKNGSSYKITGLPGENGETIQQAFNVKNKEAFERQYKKAISGDGNEKNRILMLHSSSRLALMVFYNVEENPITLEIEGKPVEFNYSTFEFKNPVIGNPSNMDVVLLSTDRKVVLFLESKFSEYYTSASNKSESISNRYKENDISRPIYEKLIGKEVGMRVYKNKNKVEETSEKFYLFMEDGSLNYLVGIKQMISHYVGIRRRLNGDTIKSDTESKENTEISKEVLSALRKDDSRVYLGEILFDKFFLPEGCKGEDPVVIRKNYSCLYEKLAQILNADIKDKQLDAKFKVLETEFEYSEVMKANKDKIEPETLRFYGIEE